MRSVVVASACRTPVGSFGGSLSSIPAPRLGAIVIDEAVKRSGIDPGLVNEVIMGNVLTAGEGQAPARQAAIFAGLPVFVECMTINKVCGSGLKSVMLGAQAIALGDADIVVAGGMESMSNVPYLLDKARSGYRLGNGELIDSLIKDGLHDVYNNYHMGIAGELCAKEYQITRETQDEFAARSYHRALDAQKKGRFQKEIVPVKTVTKSGEVFIENDEEPGKANFEKMKSLKAVFQKDGTITAANASKINDGAAALLLMSEEKAAALNCKPIARIVGAASAAKSPEWFTIAPVDAIKKVLSKCNLMLNQIGIFEINEAFSVVPLVVSRVLGLDPDLVNVNGGAVAIGHPIGASGARILVTLLHAMQDRNVKMGLASLCIGGGEASSLIVEQL